MTTAVDTAPPPVPSARTTWLAVTVVVLVSTALRALAVKDGWFLGDDFEFLITNAEGDADLAWLFERHNLHFMPLGLALTWPVAAAGSYVWAAAASQIIIIHVLAMLACWLMLRAAFGATWTSLFLLAAYGTTAITLPAMMWWAAALNGHAVQVPIFLAITAHLMYLRDGRRRYAALSVLAFVVALGFYVKAIMLPGVLFILTWAYVARGTGLVRLKDVVVRWWTLWSAYLVVGAAFLITYLLVPGGQASSGASFSDLARLVEGQAVTNLVAGLVGGPWLWELPGSGNPRQITAVPLAGLLTAWVLITGLLAHSAARHRGVLRAGAVAAIPVLGTLTVLAVGRLDVFGALTVGEIRYWADCLPYFLLTAGLASGATLSAPLKRPEGARRWADIPPLPKHLQVGLALAVIAGGTFSSVSYASTWPDFNDPKAFAEAARSQFGDVPAGTQVADEPVPDGVIEPIVHPYNLTSRFAAPFRADVEFPDASVGIRVLDDLGVLRPGRASPDLVVDPSSLRRCLTGTGEPEDIPLGAEALDFPFWVSLEYTAPTRAQASVAAGRSRHDVDISPGRHILTFRSQGAYDTVQITLPHGASMCPRALQIGQEVLPE